MKLKKKVACYCNGYARILFQATEFATQHPRFTIDARFPNGEKAPCSLYLLNQTNDSVDFAVLFPELYCVISYVIYEHDIDGNIVDNSINSSINTYSFKLASRYHMRFNNATVEQISAIEYNPNFTQPRFQIINAVEGEDEYVFQMSVEVPNDTVDPSFLSTINIDGSLSNNKIIISEASMRSAKQDSSTHYGTLTFSVSCRKPFEPYIISYQKHLFDNMAFYRFHTDEAMRAISLCYSNITPADRDPNYHSWFCKQRLSTEEIKIAVQTMFTQEFNYLPKFSLIVPLYRTRLHSFSEMIESVLCQGYEKFELILIANPNDNLVIRQAIADRQKDDARIIIVNQETDAGIPHSIYSGVLAATGEFVVFLNQYDMLEPNALLEYGKIIAKDSNTIAIYCDEDAVLPDRTYVSPYFKPAFSKYLLRETNYFGSFLAIKRDPLLSMITTSDLSDSAFYHELSLQITALPGIKHHVPKVLLHKCLASDTAASTFRIEVDEATTEAAVIENHLSSLSIPAEIRATAFPHRFFVDYKPIGNPLVSIIIPTKDNVDLLRKCLGSISNKTTYDNYEIILVENNSTDSETFEYYSAITEHDSRIRLVTWHNEFNYSSICNFGASFAQGDYLLFLNNDIEVITPQWIERMIGICQDVEVGAVGAKLNYPDNTIQHAGICISGECAGQLSKNLHTSNPGYYGSISTTHEVSSVTGACAMVTRSIFEDLGGFNPDYAVAFNDVDLCLRIRQAGYLVIYTPWVELIHYESISRGEEDTPEKQLRFKGEIARFHADWHEYYVNGDPYYNINFEPFSAYYQLRAL